jgi:transposase
MFTLSPSVRIFVCTKPTDMRKSFTGLFALVKHHLKQDPYSGSLFFFRSQRGNFIKALWFDVDGFAIFAKKLEVGTFRFPEVRFVNGEYEPIELKRADLLMLLEGIDTESVKRLKRYHRESRDQGGVGSPKSHQKPMQQPKSPVTGHPRK